MSLTLTGALLEGEFLPRYVKRAPLRGSALSVLLVFIFNRVLAQPYAELYKNNQVRALHNFLSLK